jgi:hypothetical protein
MIKRVKVFGNEPRVQWTRNVNQYQQANKNRLFLEGSEKGGVSSLMIKIPEV